MYIPEHQRRGIVEGIAAIAVTLAEMGSREEVSRRQIVGYLVQRLRIDTADLVPLLREAAVAIASFPQPLDEPVDRLERAQPIRDMLGLPDPAAEQAAALRGREWLEGLADELNRHLQ